MTGRQVLVCQDYDGGRLIAPVLERITRERAFVEVTYRDEPHWRDRERLIPTYRITFDAGMLRNTEAHGIGCRYGFVCHVEQPDREATAVGRDESESCERGTPSCSVAHTRDSECEPW